MALKFLNKKGWHTGSLRNIENVWKAEQKHDAEQKKLEELRKQIQEERERHEFRLLQEQAGLTPKQERLEFLYESGLGVGKSSEGFKALQEPAPPPSAGAAAASGASGASSSNAAAPGALFEDKPQSANDAWRKLHSDPLLLIRQREQEALARIKSNPVRMAMIRKTVEAEKDKGKKKDKKHKKKHHRDKESNHGKSKGKHLRGRTDYEEESEEDERRKEKRGQNEHYSSKSKDLRAHSDSEEESEEGGHRKEKRGQNEYYSSKLKNSRAHSDSEEESEEGGRRKERRGRNEHYSSKSKISRSHSDSEEEGEGGKMKEKRGRDEHSYKAKHGRAHSDTEEENEERLNRKDKRGRDDPSRFERDVGSKLSKRSPSRDYEYTRHKEKSRDFENGRYSSSNEKSRDREHTRNDNTEKAEREGDHHSRYDSNRSGTRLESQEPKGRQGHGYNHRPPVPKLTEEEREARLREMQLNAELHEEQRWKRLKKASEVDAQDAIKDKASAGQRTFLDDAQKSIYGTEKGGSSSIEESVRRRSYYLQGGSEASERNAFRR